MRNLIKLLFLFPLLSFGASTFDEIGIPDKPYNTSVHQEFEGPSLGGNFSLYNDSAAVPVDGTGGTQCTGFTVAQTTTNPISGTGSLLITKPSVNCQGTGVAYTISNLPGATMVTLDFDYLIASGTYVPGSSSTDSDLEVYVYDATNSKLIQPTTYKIDGIVGTDNVIHYRTWFQTPSNASGVAATLRILLHSPNTTSATGFTFKIDKWYIRTLTGSNKAEVVTGWAACTVTGSWVSNATYSAMCRRVGENTEMQVKVLTGGAPTSTALVITLPTGIVVDTAKMAQSGSTDAIIGWGTAVDSGSARFAATANLVSSTTFSINTPDDAANGLTFAGITQALPFTFGNTDYVDVYATFPTVGYSANGSVSNDDGRVVAFSANGSSTSITSGGDAVIPTTVTSDSHGAFTLATATYTVPVSGWYQVNGFMLEGSVAWTAGDSTTGRLFKNGSQVQYCGGVRADASTTTSYFFSLSCLVLANAGDTLVMKGFATRTNSMTDYYLQYNRLGGGSFVSPTESVAAVYDGQITGTLNGSANIGTVPTKIRDTHNAYSSGTYTVPLSGSYNITCMASISGTCANDSNSFAYIYVGGVEKVQSYTTHSSVMTSSMPSAHVDGYALNAGDAVTCRFATACTGPSYSATATRNLFSINRTGP